MLDEIVEEVEEVRMKVQVAQEIRRKIEEEKEKKVMEIIQDAKGLMETRTGRIEVLMARNIELKADIQATDKERRSVAEQIKRSEADRINMEKKI